jgi:KDO2-lipid IV(A) lauroyltransferase
MKSLWKSLRHELEWLGVGLLASLIPRLPRPIVYQFGRLAGSLAAFFDRGGWRVALSNLEAAFGDRFSAAEREQVARASYQQFAGTMIDLLWSPRITAENCYKLIEFQGLEELDRTIGLTNSYIAATCHYGNFEWFSLASGFAGMAGTIVVQQFKNPRLDPLFNNLRQRSGHQIVTRERAIVRLYKALRRGSRVAILVDLTLHPQRLPIVAIDCFGLKTSVTFAHAWLHSRTGLPIVPMHVEPLPGGRCRVVIHPKLEIPPGATYQEIAQLCWDQFEPIIRENPSPWLWMYRTWRYRPENAERSYPFYAHSAPRLDKLIAQKEADLARLSEPGDG